MPMPHLGRGLSGDPHTTDARASVPLGPYMVLWKLAPTSPSRVRWRPCVRLVLLGHVPAVALLYNRVMSDSGTRDGMIAKARHMMGGLGRRFNFLARDRKGALLLETIIAITLLGSVGTALVVGLQTTNRSGAFTESQGIREEIARNQMEDIFSRAFLGPTTTSSYPVITSVDPNHSVTNSTAPYSGDPNIQLITVTVEWGDRGTLVLETLRVK